MNVCINGNFKKKGSENIIVEDIISACEYINCEVLDALGEVIEVNESNYKEIYEYSIESLSAKDNKVLIWTFINMDKLEEGL